MITSDIYSQLVHDISGSRSKNRFRAELNWGISKMLDLMKTDRDFTIVFDYVCDIEVHHEGGCEFYQVKTDKSSTSTFKVKKLITKEDGQQNSILGKLYVLKVKGKDRVQSVAIVSNRPFKAEKTVHEEESFCFDVLPDDTRAKLVAALETELKIATVELKDVFYLYTRMDLDHPDDAILGKLARCFESIKGVEAIKLNALWRLISDTVKEKACCELVDEKNVFERKGLRREEISCLMDRHSRQSNDGFLSTKKGIDAIENLGERRRLNKALSFVIECLEKGDKLRAAEKRIAEDLISLEEMHSLGNEDETVKELLERNESVFPVEFRESDRIVFVRLIVNRFMEGCYENADDIS